VGGASRGLWAAALTLPCTRPAFWRQGMCEVPLGCDFLHIFFYTIFHVCVIQQQSRGRQERLLASCLLGPAQPPHLSISPSGSPRGPPAALGRRSSNNDISCTWGLLRNVVAQSCSRPRNLSKLLDVHANIRVWEAQPGALVL
jgi:hypothetical protein